MHSGPIPYYGEGYTVPPTLPQKQDVGVSFVAPKPLIHNYISVAELCQILKIGKTLAYELLNSGEIEAIKIKKNTRIPISSVEAFLSRQPKAFPQNNDDGQQGGQNV